MNIVRNEKIINNLLSAHNKILEIFDEGGWQKGPRGGLWKMGSNGKKIWKNNGSGGGGGKAANPQDGSGKPASGGSGKKSAPKAKPTHEQIRSEVDKLRKNAGSMSKGEMEHHVDNLFRQHGVKEKDVGKMKGHLAAHTAKNTKELKDKLVSQLMDSKRNKRTQGDYTPVADLADENESHPVADLADEKHGKKSLSVKKSKASSKRKKKSHPVADLADENESHPVADLADENETHPVADLADDRPTRIYGGALKNPESAAEYGKMRRKFRLGE